MRHAQLTLACVLTTFVSALAIVVLSKLAKPAGLLDVPGDRKQHSGDIPLVGGLAIYMAMLAGVVFYGNFDSFSKYLVETSAIFVILGCIDDRYDLTVRARLFVQIVGISCMIALSGVYIHRLGHIFADTNAELGQIGLLVTVVAVIGLLNAFNMMDGIDGLAGGLGMVSIGAVILFDDRPELHGAKVILVMLASAMIPYMAANLGFLGRKIFLGDAGSMLMGYLLSWVLIRESQTAGPSGITPVDVLWCVALPIFDTLAVICRRLREGKSPFKSDRNHIHHILHRAGLRLRWVLVVLLGMAVGLASIGKALHPIGERVSFVAFLGLLAAYVLGTTRPWSVDVRLPTKSDQSHDPAYK